MLQFDESFFEPEEREGFMVRGMMKRYWASSMECLAEIDRICKKHGLRYFAFYGTLLGAVRHKGYIPWDDDMDIIMYRDDYNGLIRAVKEEGMTKPFELYNVMESCLYPMRIINTHYTLMKDEFLEQFHGCPYPSGIDIYVMDKVPTEELDVQVVRHLHQVVRYLSQRVDRNYESTFHDSEKLAKEDIEEVVRGIEEFTHVKITIDNTLAAQLAKLAAQISAMYNDTDSPYVARIHNWSVFGEQYKWNKEWFDEIVYLPFENMMLPCPKMYHEVLEATMGKDYMTPIKFLNAHEYPCFKEYEEQLLMVFKACGATPPEFLFE